MSQVLLTLTPAESKRLIAKAVAALPEVKKALRGGVVVICVGTTNGYVAEELGLRVDRTRFAAGVVLPKGTCAVSGGLREIVLVRGKETGKRLSDVIGDLGPRDVVIKGANAIDSSGAAGVFLASEDGGTVGRFFGSVVSRGVNLVIPVGLEKFVPGSLSEVSRIAGTRRFVHATGLPVGLAVLHGKIVTEVEAMRVLTGASATPIGKGGVSGAEGSVTLLVSGSESQISRARDLVSRIKGEKPLIISTDCGKCDFSSCFMHG
jgi:hypothetical protein